MEQVIEGLLTKLLEHGPWGFLVAWLMYSNYRANNRIDASDIGMTAMLERHAQQREKSAEVMTASAAAINEVSKAVAALGSQLEDISGDASNMKAVGAQICERLNSLSRMVENDIASRRGRRV